MAYATQQDLIDRFGETELVQLADRDGDGVADSATVDGAIADADLVIDTYVGKRYDLPLASTPALLTQISCHVARYFLFKDSPPEVVTENYRAALRQLRDIAAGAAVLDVAGAEPARDGEVVLTSGPDRVFDRDKLDDF